MRRSISGLSVRGWCTLVLATVALVVGVARTEPFGVLFGVALLFLLAATTLPFARYDLEAERGIVRPGFDKVDVLALAALGIIGVAALAAAVVGA